MNFLLRQIIPSRAIIYLNVSSLVVLTELFLKEMITKKEGEILHL